jgi:thiamine-monophosphate kinase
MKVSALGEFPLIDRVAQRLPPYREDVRVGVGDDVAVLRLDDEMYQLATCDIQVEGAHFLRDSITAYQLGRKAAAINLSDIAAKGGTPQHFLISLALPPDTEVSWVDALYDGLREEASRYGADIVGGNMCKTDGPIVVDVFLLGQVRHEEALLRSGARVGDVVLVTGSLGESAAGLALALQPDLDVGKEEAEQLLAAHFTPTPRVSEGRAIAGRRRATAMIDLSDGLSSDIGHICDASHVGVRLWADRLPVAVATRRVAELTGRLHWALALQGGEDYELCFTAPRDGEGELAGAVKETSGIEVTAIGEVLPEKGGRWVQLPDGKEIPLEREGWNHFRAGG